MTVQFSATNIFYISKILDINDFYSETTNLKPYYMYL